MTKKRKRIVYVFPYSNVFSPRIDNYLENYDENQKPALRIVPTRLSFYREIFLDVENRSTISGSKIVNRQTDGKTEIKYSKNHIII